jgi:spermidine synthase
MPVFLAIAMISAAVIGYEILLMRLFSIIQWHHFAYMVISIALLGYGASGTIITLAREWMLRHFDAVFAAAAALFGLTAAASFALAQRVPFNPLELVWDPWQQFYLLQLYLLLAVPFTCGATCVGLTFCRFGDRINIVYRYDLIGAGAGALGLVAAMFVLTPEYCLRLIIGTGFTAAAIACVGREAGRRPAAVLFATGVAGAIVWPQSLLAPLHSPYKELSQALLVPGTQVIEERASPLGVLTVVASPRVPFRHAPGLSLAARGRIPPQLGVFTDGDAMTAITRYDGEREDVAYLDQQSAALPYHLLDRPRVLILGAGGGSDVLLALYHHARTVDAVELNPQMVDLVRRTHADFAGRLYDHRDVRVHVAEARGFVTRSRDRYDLISVALLDSFAASSAGLYALTESTLYTVEALEAYLRRLAPGGFLAITRWLNLPPRDSLKMFATAVASLQRLGVERPGSRLALVRSWNTVTLVVKNGDITGREVGVIESFAEARSFDRAYHPGIEAAAVNRNNVLHRPYLYEGARALLGPEGERFLRDYKFHVAPATDDAPYFFRFFKWETLPELLALWEAGSVQLMEWGYVILVVTLVQAALASLIIILLPLKALKRDEASAVEGRPVARIVVYFLALGLAFLFIEIAFIQRFTLFLSHPLYAVAVVLCAFLVFAGLGSGYSERLVERQRARAVTGPWLPPIGLAVLGIVASAGGYMVLLPLLFDWLLPLPQAAKVLISILLIAPLAFCMGMPFPLGLKRVSDEWPSLVPWAWGINGCASVMSAILATLLAIHFGFTVVVALALAFYALAAAVFGERRPRVVTKPAKTS